MPAPPGPIPPTEPGPVPMPSTPPWPPAAAMPGEVNGHNILPLMFHALVCASMSIRVNVGVCLYHI